MLALKSGQTLSKPGLNAQRSLLWSQIAANAKIQKVASSQLKQAIEIAWLDNGGPDGLLKRFKMWQSLHFCSSIPALLLHVP
jgi:hypothetical protein